MTRALSYSEDLPPGCHDEARGARGEVRPSWRPFLDALATLGLPELERRWEEAKHLIRENGVTYNVYGDPRGMHRPWRLDPVPLLLAAEEARSLEQGLIQRALLLERLLADLYGPQSVLSQGLLPTELIHAHPGFLRPCHGIGLPRGRHLHLYAGDVGRAADGQFWVLGDRTQAPSGAGYALENRIVLSRTLPDVVAECRVERLAPFFQTLRDTLRSLAPTHRDNPRVVLLTPGPYNETYFEHAYLARYLGYTLVEGGDLTVRDARVFLKVLGGLQPVDVILRRLDADFCDPLELRRNSFLGVPGLVEAVRAGNVAVANPLGSGLVESPALLPFLPALCRHLLGEELRLPSCPTWWCGEERSRHHVLANFPSMVIKMTYAPGRREPIFVDRLSSLERSELIERIRHRPCDYVGQERLPLSTTPVFDQGRLQPRRLVLRTFATAAGESFVLMPGGLTRVTRGVDSLVVSMQQGGGSKDTWVLASGPVSPVSLLNSSVLPVELSRGGSDLPSRAADNLYWLGRYAERAEGMVRLLRCALERLIERPGLVEAPELPSLFRALSPDAGPPLEDATNPVEEILALLYDSKRPVSLAAVVALLQRAAGMVRDRISMDMWRVVSALELPEHSRSSSEGDALDLLNRLVGTLAAFGGLAMESMTRSQGWRFLDMGRRLERALQTATLLRRTLVETGAMEGPVLEAVLEVADSSMTYRRRYLGSLQMAPVLDLLLADETNPRAVAFQLAALVDDVAALPRETTRPGRCPEERLSLSLLTAVRLVDIDELATPETKGPRIVLDRLLARFEAELPILSETLTQRYLSHLQVARHLTGSGPGDRS